ncbi:family 20 glycosylhydrolase [Gaetbulibacter sp. M235]|uniref:beta-N-acetylhexosaminidase n=1 Tax=Gaetbulibacter sp. M235 TaxID=3126510 RepID=UPI00374ED140
MKKYHISIVFLIVSIFNINASNNQELKKYLVPIPKSVTVLETSFKPNSGRIIAYGIATNLGVRFSANNLQKILKEKGMYFSIAGNVAVGETPEIELIIDSKKQTNSQGYSLVINENKITLTANNEAGLYYGVLTLGQIAQYAYDYGTFPQVTVNDYPDFKRRGVTIDISRTKVPTMASLYQYIDMFASWKINEIQLYTEHTFQYQNHKKVWQDASALSSNDILDLDKYCSDRFIDLVPNQNGFGHMERWLEHKEYWHLAENETISDPTHHILGIRRTISAVDKSSVDFVDNLYSELLSNFSSENVNIGGDEPYELGTGKSKKEVSEKGKGQVYLDLLLKLNSIIVKNGKRAQFWGDIILEHPELIKNLPKNITCMIWGYKWDHPFNKEAAKFKEAKIPFYVCPGTSSWRSIVGRTENAIKNQINAAENGIKYGAVGYLNTDWGDDGHPQPLITGYAPYVYGAAVSWSLEDNRDLDINWVLNKYIYKDPAEKTAQVIFDMGNTNQILDNSDINNYSFYSLLYYINKPLKENRQTAKLKNKDLNEAIIVLNKIIKRVETCKATANDAEIVYREIINASKLAIHSCNLGIAKLKTKEGSIEKVDADTKYKLLVEIDAIIAEYKEVWMLRNQIGGLTDSLEQLLKVRTAYLN